MKNQLLNIQKILVVAGVLLISHTASAQITFPDDVNDEGPAAPIDGFIVIGLAAGAYLGFRKRNQKGNN